MSLDDNANEWYTRELGYEEMREIREGYYSTKRKRLSLKKSVEFNTGYILRKARMNLGEGLLYLGFLFPYRSELEDALEPEHIEEEDEDEDDFEDDGPFEPRISLDEDHED